MLVEQVLEVRLGTWMWLLALVWDPYTVRWKQK